MREPFPQVGLQLQGFLFHYLIGCGLGFRVEGETYWLYSQLFNFWGSYKVVDSESFNCYFLGFWASEL